MREFRVFVRQEITINFTPVVIQAETLEQAEAIALEQSQEQIGEQTAAVQVLWRAVAVAT